MEFNDTFVPNLYAVKFPESDTTIWSQNMSKYFSSEDFGSLDELERNTDLWDNIEYLYDFFNLHEESLHSEFWQNMTVEEAVLCTRDCADSLNDVLDESENLELIFQTLSDGDIRATVLKFHKMKIRRNCLRLYAIKLSDGKFIITGGVIKLTQKMQDCPVNNLELLKLKRVKNFLIKQDVFDDESFESYMLEE